MTVLYVTHSPSELKGLAHFVYQMNSEGWLEKITLLILMA